MLCQKMLNDHFHTLVGRAWPLPLPARECTSTHRLQDGWVFRLRDTWFYAHLLLSADTISIFH